MPASLLNQALVLTMDTWNQAQKNQQYITTLNIASCVTASLSILLIYRTFFHPLAAVPGPKLARLTGLYRTYHYLRGTWHDDVVYLHKKYGRTIRVGPNEISTVDGGALKKVYGHGLNNAPKTSYYDTFRVQLPDPFNVVNKQKHALLRRRVASAYTMSAVLRYEPYLQGCLDLCFSKFRELTKAGKLIDMSEWTNALAFDVIAELVCGQQMGHLREGMDVGLIRTTIHTITRYATVLGDFPTQSSFLKHPVTIFVQTRILGMSNPTDSFLKFCMDRIQDRRAGKSGIDRNDMLTHFMEASPNTGSSQAKEDLEILRDIQTAFGAGSDTTSISMRSCIYFLGTHPGIYALLQKEIDHFCTTHDFQGPFTYIQTQQIPLLRAVVAESLRLLPPISGQLFRVSPGVMIDKYWIPPNYTIGISAMAVNREKTIFGEDAEDFRPDRWLESDDAYTRLDNTSLSFGSGSRACIGKNIALVEVQKFIGQLYRNFDVEIANKERPWKLNFYFILNQTELMVRLKPRFV